MRPHMRVFPLILVFGVVVATLAMIPVDPNERRCRDTPEDALCEGPPVWVPWMQRMAEQGY